jgi:hypothetical protein
MMENIQTQLDTIGATQERMVAQRGPKTWELLAAVNQFAWDEGAKWGMDYRSAVQMILAWETQRPTS